MRLGVRGRLLVLSVALLTLAALLFALFVDQKLEAQLTEQAQGDLMVRAALSAERAGAAEDLRREAPLLALALARASGARVTLIDPDGVVQGDSEVPKERLGELENHAGRPEVKEAIATGKGTSRRESATVHERLLYAARRVDRPDGPWVVRLALFPSAVGHLVAQAKDALAQGTLVAVLVAAALSFVSSSVFTRRIRELTETARTMRLDLSKRARIQGSDEVAVLGAALDELTSDLEGSIRDLSSQRDQLEAMLESMQEGVVIVGEDGTIRLANPAFCALLQVEPDVAGRKLLEVVRNAALYELVEEARQKGRTASREIEMVGRRRVRLLGRASPLARPGGGVVALLFDVTELRRLESVRRDFVANVSHELRTPVASIRAASETLEAGALGDPEAAIDFVDIIARNADRLARLIEDLLDLSRIEAGGLAMQLEGVPVREACEACAALFRPRAAARRSELALEVPEGLSVRADRGALEQVLTNLLDNAIKYSPQGSHVALRARAEGGKVIFEIQDDGPGIEEPHLGRLFERFYRVDVGRSRALGGTGLGLSIVKHLVETLGGRVSVTSEVGRGTTFAVELPAA